MAGTFGKGGPGAAKNEVLARAKAEGQLPPKTDLRIPDKKVGVAKSVPKTKEIMKVERDIAKNVEQQKAAIKAGNFELVAVLKDIYNVLVQHLKDLIKAVKEEKNKQGGFIDPNAKFTNRASDGSTKGGRQSPKEGESQSLGNDTTLGKAKQALDPLAQEARKYKSAEEFVNSPEAVSFLSKTQEGGSKQLILDVKSEIVDRAKTGTLFGNNKRFAIQIVRRDAGGRP